MLVCLGVFLVSGWKAWGILEEYRAGSEHYSQLEQYVSTEHVQPEVSLTPVVQDHFQQEPAEEPKEHIETAPQVDFAALAQINPQVAGWLCIEGTQIQYPVVQGEDNSFYLKHRFDRTYSSAGCLFLDAAGQSDFLGHNNIVYGHYMKNGSMFSALKEYKHQEFYDAHPTGWLVTPMGSYQIRFFSGYVSDTAGSAWDLEFSDEGYGTWLAALTEKSCFKAQVVPTTEDRIITLSTCSYEFENARFVVHGIMEAVE